MILDIRVPAEKDPKSGRWFAAVAACNDCNGDVILDGIPAICMDCKKEYTTVSIQEYEDGQNAIKSTRDKGQQPPDMSPPALSQLPECILTLADLEAEWGTIEFPKNSRVSTRLASIMIARENLQYLFKSLSLWG